MSSRNGYGISAANPEGFVSINSRFLPDQFAIFGRAFSNGLIKRRIVPEATGVRAVDLLAGEPYRCVLQPQKLWCLVVTASV